VACKHPGGQRYRVVLEALGDDVPPHVRLRAFLKSALRAWGLRCRSVEELPPSRVQALREGRGGAEALGE
jgi:hypothetical protein